MRFVQRLLSLPHSSPHHPLPIPSPSLLRRKRKKPKFDDPATHLKLVSFQKSLTQQLTAGGEAAVKSLEERFMAHDSDASGSLSEKEYIKAMKQFAKAAHLTDEATGKGFSTKDWQLIFAFMDDGEAGKGPDGKDLSPEIECVRCSQ